MKRPTLAYLVKVYFRALAAILLGCGAANVWGLPAFPGAEGWGADTPGGRGGRVYIVTNLNADGEGSLKAGLLLREPRIIVFRVSGVIPLTINRTEFNELNSYFTIAGQTSPGGITLSGGNWVSYGVDLHDFVFRFLRFRNTGVNDGIQFGPHHHFVFDHCDFSGGEDETTDLFYSYYFTMQWCTVANSEATTSKGTLVACTDTACRADHITFHHNLWAHHFERTPAFFWDQEPPDHGLVDLRNNVVYNVRNYSNIFSGNSGDPWPGGGEGRANMVGNTWKQGPSVRSVIHTPFFQQVVKVYEQDNCFYQTDGRLVVSDELGGGITGCNVLERRYGAGNRAPSSWDTPPVTTTSGTQAYDEVLNRAGAFPLDPMNRRTAGDVRTGTGDLLVVDDCLLWETRLGTPAKPEGCVVSSPLPAPPADTDRDGMADAWESAMSVSDPQADPDNDGYTNIEEYINDLALARLGEGCRIDDHRSRTAIQAILSAWGETPPAVPADVCAPNPEPPARPRRLRVR